MLRIIVAHNFYGSEAPSGENRAFNAERSLLQERGHELGVFTRHSDNIRRNGVWGSLGGALSTPWNPIAAAAIRRQVDAFQTDVVHVHNTFPLLSPAVFRAVAGRAARVLTLHNYRLFCAAAIPTRDGRVCTECMDGQTAWPAMKYGCYRNSRLATFPVAVGVELHRVLGTWERHVDAFIALSDFQRDRMVQAGLPAERVHVKPNFFPGNPKPVAWKDRGDYVVFAGRLSSEKGIENTVRAWLSWGEQAPELRVLGEGPLREALDGLLLSAPATRIRFLGQVSPYVALQQIANAKLLILPSQCFEGFPMVIREAFAFGTPAAVSALGPLPSIVHDGVSGVVFSPADSPSLLQKVRTAWEAPGLLEALSAGARAAYECHYTEDANYRMLMAIYESAIALSKERNGRRGSSNGIG